ncbi:MAG: DHH family phosphoesterase [Clostridiales bacterium]|nr:DHH family phosphoesterase [Clostridiales bacterium]
MKLSDLLEYDDIVIQCHDNPDADAIASGFGIYSYLHANKKKVRFIYSGNFIITKTNLKFMVEALNIPIEYVVRLNRKPKLLITCDCLYGEGNVRRFEAETIASIDHHYLGENKPPRLNDVRQGVGSCSTIVWDLLRKEGFEINKSLSTALYYGLYTDTNTLAEIYHPLDRDMLDDIVYDKSLIKHFCNMNMTLQEVKIAGMALLGYEYHEVHRYALLETMPCDPNILGLISDFFLAVDNVDVCVVFSELDVGIKYSVRSCTNEVRADELAEYISRRIGSGGGRSDKAGGLIQKELLADLRPDYLSSDDIHKHAIVTTVLRERLHDYYQDCRIIYAGKDKLDTSKMKVYKKLPLKQGYVIPAEFLPIGTPILVRSLEGDYNLNVTEDSVIMIGVRGEVYASNTKVFGKNYKKLDEDYKLKLEYFPTIKNTRSGEILPLNSVAKTCVSEGGNRILAMPIKTTTKVFTKWNGDEYLKGEPGDYLAAKESDPDDVYIINKDIFTETYALEDK